MHKLHEMLEKIEEKMSEELNHGIDNVDTEEFGKVADLYKDLMEAKKLYLEACYYKHVVKAMEEMDPEDETAQDYLDFAMKRYYRGQPRSQSGRFMSRGDGRRSNRGRRGYEEPMYYTMTPEMMKAHAPEYYRDMDRMEGRMYYTGGSGGSGSSGGGSMSSSEMGGGMSSSGMSGGSRNYGGESSSRSENARRGYEETKMMQDGSPEAKKKAMESLENYMKELGEDLTEMVKKMDNSEKAMLKQKLQVLNQKIQ